MKLQLITDKQRNGVLRFVHWVLSKFPHYKYGSELRSPQYDVIGFSLSLLRRGSHWWGSAKRDRQPFIQEVNFFDWFIVFLALFWGFSFLLLPSYTQRIEFQPFILVDVGAKVMFLFIGLGLICLNCLGGGRERVRVVLHLLFAVLLLGMSYIFLRTGSAFALTGYVSAGLLLLISLFVYLPEHFKFFLLFVFFMIGNGIIFWIHPTSFFLQDTGAFSSIFIDAIFTVWLLLTLILSFLGLLGHYKSKKLYIIITTTIALGLFGYAYFTLRQALWNQAILALLLGSFFVVLPYVEQYRRLTFPSKTVYIKTLLWFAGTFFMAVLLVLYLQLSSLKRLEVENIQNLRGALVVINTMIEEGKGDVSLFSKDEGLIRDMSLVLPRQKNNDVLSQFDTYARTLLTSSTTLRRVLLIDANGQGVSVYPSDVAFRQLHFADRSYFSAARAYRKTVVAETLQPRIPNAPGPPVVIALAAPIFGRNGEFLGVVAGSMDIEKLEARINSMRQGKGYIAIANTKTQFVVHPDASLIMQTPSAGNPLWWAVKGEQGQTLLHNQRGILTIQAYAPIPVLGWGIVSVQPLLEIMEQMSMTAFLIFLTTLFSGIGSFLYVVVQVTHTLTRTVSKQKPKSGDETIQT